MTDFESLADRTLDHLYQQCEDRFTSGVEIDLADGVLRLEWDDGSVYLINRHSVSRQIWLSSPKSGAWHFAANDRGDWISTRNQDLSMIDVLNRELEPEPAFAPLS